MLTDAARLHPQPGTTRHLARPGAPSSATRRSAHVRVHPAVTRIAIWLALGLGGWTVVGSALVVGFRFLG